MAAYFIVVRTQHNKEARERDNMSKSTPISQLPFQGAPGQAVSNAQQQQQMGAIQPQQHFVNDQHRQLVAQAQHAAQNYSLPQSSTLDIGHDDDIVVQEALQYATGGGGFGGSTGQAGQLPGSSSAQLQQQLQQQQLQQQQLQQQQQQMYDLPGPPADAFSTNQLYQGAVAPASYASSSAAAPTAKTWLSGSLGDDLRHVLLAVIAHVLVTVVPVEGLIDRYVAISNIPYSSLLIKAAVLGVAVFVGRHVLDMI
jgi:hypothetical protein